MLLFTLAMLALPQCIQYVGLEIVIIERVVWSKEGTCWSCGLVMQVGLGLIAGGA